MSQIIKKKIALTEERLCFLNEEVNRLEILKKEKEENQALESKELSEAINVLKQDKRRLDEELEALNGDICTLKTSRNDMNEQVKSVSTKLTKTDEECVKAINSLDSVLEDVERLEKGKSVSTSELDKINSLIEDKREELVEIEKLHNEKLKSNDKDFDQLKEDKRGVLVLKAELLNKSNKLDARETILKELESKNKELNIELEDDKRLAVDRLSSITTKLAETTKKECEATALLAKSKSGANEIEAKQKNIESRDKELKKREEEFILKSEELDLKARILKNKEKELKLC